MQQSATDPTTGTIDMDCINIGVSSTDRRARDQLSNEVLAMLRSEFDSSMSKMCYFVSSTPVSCMLINTMVSTHEVPLYVSALNLFTNVSSHIAKLHPNMHILYAKQPLWFYL